LDQERKVPLQSYAYLLQDVYNWVQISLMRMVN